MMVVVMGVAGVGKTTVGRELAARLDCRFVDADKLHAAKSIRKMSSGIPLSDDDRIPWLRRVRAELMEAHDAESDLVVACSALKESYRSILTDGVADVRFVYLKTTPEVILRRLSDRRDHYFGESLLESQFDALEEPAAAIVADASQDVRAVVSDIIDALRQK